MLAIGTHQLKEKNPDVHARWRTQVAMVAAHPHAHRNVIHVMDREANDYALLADLIAGNHRFIIRARVRSPVARVGQPSSSAGGHGGHRARRGDALDTREVSKREQTAADPSTAPCAGREPRLFGPGGNATAPDLCSEGSAALLRLNIVRVWESASPNGEQPVEWLLLTFEPITMAAEMVRIVDCYRSRWIIEKYFKALKTGCSYEKRQLESFHALRNPLAVFAPMACRLLLLRTEARHRPRIPCFARPFKAPPRCTCVGGKATPTSANRTRRPARHRQPRRPPSAERRAGVARPYARFRKTRDAHRGLGKIK